jgi:hypothetical protein
MPQFALKFANKPKRPILQPSELSEYTRLSAMAAATTVCFCIALYFSLSHLSQVMADAWMVAHYG